MATCPQCGEEPAGNAGGLCPRCMILGALDSSIGGDDKTQTLDTAARSDDDFGRYHILRPIGEGGMGTVYLAEQREPIRRTVALKVVKLGMDTGQVLARFDNERQALAMMDHPNIARIFDAGATPKGRPYFVMEYIEGAPITQYCDARRMAIPERLELFLAVCRAVQHAHQKGIIHRDLKPSNVLVAEHEGTALAKVIDFGIAKATDQWAVENTLLTQFGQMVGTPEYASPEQAEVTTGEVSEVSDVYSLGVILYELLIGTVPFDAAIMRKAGLSEMLRVIREEDAPRLSRRLATMGGRATEIAGKRQLDLASLRRAVDGDLTWIAAKALEKTRERRYASVAEFAADLQKYLEHRPVLASPPGAIYRALKFVRRHRLGVFGATAGLAFLLLGGLTVSLWVRPGTPLAPATPAATIVLAEFANTTGDPAFDGALRQTLTAELGKSGSLQVLSDTRVREILRLMVRPADTKVTPDVASEICERTYSAAAIDGSIARLGSQFLVSLRSRNCRTGDILAEEQAPAANKDEVFQALERIAHGFRTRVAASLPKVIRDPSLRTDVTTSSLEAWRSYSAAMKSVQTRSLAAETISLLRRAVELDPKFAMAYAFMGRDSEDMVRNIVKAYELRDQVSDWENYFITFTYHRAVTRNLELGRQALESWAQKYPENVEVHGLLSGFTSQGVGQYEKAVEEGQKAIALDPYFAMAYSNTAFAYVYQNRLTDAEEMLRRAAEHKIDIVNLSQCRYIIDFLRNDTAAMERETSRRRGKLEAQGSFEYEEAQTLAYLGRVSEASRLSDRALLLARQGGLSERAALFQGARAVWEALFGLRAQAQSSAASALSTYRSRDTDYGSAFALTLLSESGQAHRIEADLEKRYPEDTSVHFSYLPVLRALDVLNRGNAAKALEITQHAAVYELGVPGTAYYAGGFYGALYPAYVRGLAYSRMGRHAEAATEFQKIIDHPGMIGNDPIGPLARLQLARELFAAGERAKSAAVYKDLLAIWKDADADLPVVKEARADAVTLR